MLNQFSNDNDTQNSGPQQTNYQSQSQFQISPFNGSGPSQTDDWLSQIEVKLTGRLVATPEVKSSDGTGKVELTFLVQREVSRLGKSYFRDSTYAGASENVLVWCTTSQFSRISRQLNPHTRLAVFGKPLAILGVAHKPQLAIVCRDLRITGSGWSKRLIAGKSRLALCWASIFGGILLLNLLLPKLIPPGLLPLALLLGGMRLVEELEFVPETVKVVLHRYLVKILLLATVLVAIWFFIQYSYFTTARFR